MADELFRLSGEPYRTLTPPPVRGQAGGGYGGPGLWEILASLTGLGISAAGGALGPPLLGIANLIGQGRTRQQAVARQTQLAGYLQNHPLGSAMMAMARRGEVPEPLLYQLLRGEFEEQQRKEQRARTARPFEEEASRIQGQTEAATGTPEASIALPSRFERERLPQLRAAAAIAREGETDPSRFLPLLGPPARQLVQGPRGAVLEVGESGEVRPLVGGEPKEQEEIQRLAQQFGVDPATLADPVELRKFISHLVSSGHIGKAQPLISWLELQVGEQEKEERRGIIDKMRTRFESSRALLSPDEQRIVEDALDLARIGGKEGTAALRDANRLVLQSRSREHIVREVSAMKERLARGVQLARTPREKAVRINRAIADVVREMGGLEKEADNPSAEEASRQKARIRLGMLRQYVDELRVELSGVSEPQGDFSPVPVPPPIAAPGPGGAVQGLERYFKQ